MTTHYSLLYGLTIKSPFSLPGAHVLETAQEPDVTITWEPQAAWRKPIKMLAAFSVDPDAPRLWETADGALCVAWRRELQLVFAPSNDNITVICTAAKLEFVPTVLVGIGLGLLLNRLGIVCVHGSVVLVGGRAIALLGDSGTGKSTAAAALVASGGTLISDDIAALRLEGEKFTVAWGCANLRLDQATSARLVGSGQHLAKVPWIGKVLWDVSGGTHEASGPAHRLNALYVLETAVDTETTVVSTPIPSAQALLRLVECWYPQGFIPLLTQARFDTLREVTEKVPIYRLRYPRNWDILPQLIAELGA